MVKLVVLGSVCQDVYPLQAHVCHGGPPARIDIDGRSFDIDVDGPALPGSKVVAENVEMLCSPSARIKPGGGSYISTKQLIKLLGNAAAIHYVDTSCGCRSISEGLGDQDVQVSFLGRHEIPTNVVIGSGTDRIILKSRINFTVPTPGCPPNPIPGFENVDAILINSPKNVQDFQQIIGQAGNRPRLTCVITPSLPAWFLIDPVLSSGHTVILSEDELSSMAGKSLPPYIQDGQAALELFSGFGVMCFVTLGKDGVLVSADKDVYHIRLNQTTSACMQAQVRRSPERVNGAGDAFAAGVFSYIEAGCSLLPDPVLKTYPIAVSGALAGCCAAINWIGYPNPVEIEDFDITPVC